MSATKERILDTALLLFNRQGTDSVTIRHIAREMGISHGNLQYHYPNTDRIIHALYQRLVQHFDELMLRLPQQVFEDLSAFGQSVEATFALIYEYRFIYLHFVEITRRIPEIGRHYRQLVKKRAQQLLRLFAQMQAKGLMRKEMPESVLQSLVYQLYIIADCWLSSNEITLQLKGKKAVAHYTQVFRNTLYPYLTAKGLKQLYLTA